MEEQNFGGARRLSNFSTIPITPSNVEATDDVFGVVVASEISEDRRQTLLTVAIGEPENLVILLTGGADSFLGRLVRIDGVQSRLYGADNERISFLIVGAASIPPMLNSSGKALPEIISKRRAKKAVQTEAQRIVSVRDKLSHRYERDGLKGDWSIGDLLQLLARLGGSEKDRIAQITALRIFRHAMHSGDCSAAAKLAAELSPDRRDRLKIWFQEFSPVNLRLDTQPLRARINRRSERNFAINDAGANPFYTMPKQGKTQRAID